MATSTFLGLSEVNREVAVQLLESILYTFKKATTNVVTVAAVSYKEALGQWDLMTRSREVVQHYESRDRHGVVRSLSVVPRAEELLKAFHGDSTFMDRINGIYKKLNQNN